LSGDEFLLDLLTRRLREMQTAVVPESVMREEGVAVGVELRCGDRYRITVERIKDG
jgi:hypothetical protein